MLIMFLLVLVALGVAVTAWRRSRRPIDLSGITTITRSSRYPRVLE